MKIIITIIVEIADDNKYFVTKATEDNVAWYIENKIDDLLGIKVIECNGVEDNEIDI